MIKADTLQRFGHGFFLLEKKMWKYYNIGILVIFMKEFFYFIKMWRK